MGGKIKNVSLVGSDEKVGWSTEHGGLKIRPPKSKPFDFAHSFKVEL